MSGPAEKEPQPTLGKDVVGVLVLNDISERMKFGKNKYGAVLRTFNGRDALWDAYQEALDLVMYLRQEIMEREGREHVVESKKG